VSRTIGDAKSAIATVNVKQRAMFTVDSYRASCNFKEQPSPSFTEQFLAKVEEESFHKPVL
jgi:hypothetical protein